MNIAHNVLRDLEPSVRNAESAAIIAHAFLGGIFARVLLNEMIPTVEVEAARMALDLAKMNATVLSDRLDDLFLNPPAVPKDSDEEPLLVAAYDRFMAAEQAFESMIDDDRKGRTAEESKAYEARYQAAHNAAEEAFRDFLKFRCEQLSTRRIHASYLIKMYRRKRFIADNEDMESLLEAIAA